MHRLLLLLLCVQEWQLLQVLPVLLCVHLSVRYLCDPVYRHHELGHQVRSWIRTRFSIGQQVWLGESLVNPVGLAFLSDWNGSLAVCSVKGPLLIRSGWISALTGLNKNTPVGIIMIIVAVLFTSLATMSLIMFKKVGPTTGVWKVPTFDLCSNLHILIRSMRCTAPRAPALRGPSRSLPPVSCPTRRCRLQPLMLPPELLRGPLKSKSDWCSLHPASCLRTIPLFRHFCYERGHPVIRNSLSPSYIMALLQTKPN